MDNQNDNSQGQQGQDSGSQDSGNANPGTNLPDRDPQVLERGDRPRGLEKRDK
jgi:hypothetical protein